MSDVKVHARIENCFSEMSVWSPNDVASVCSRLLLALFRTALMPFPAEPVFPYPVVRVTVVVQRRIKSVTMPMNFASHQMSTNNDCAHDKRERPFARNRKHFDELLGLEWLLFTVVSKSRVS